MQIIPFSSFPHEKTVTCENFDPSRKQKLRKIGEGHQHQYQPYGVEDLKAVLLSFAENSKAEACIDDLVTSVKDSVDPAVAAVTDSLAELPVPLHADPSDDGHSEALLPRIDQKQPRVPRSKKKNIKNRFAPHAATADVSGENVDDCSSVLESPHQLTPVKQKVLTVGFVGSHLILFAH